MTRVWCAQLSPRVGELEGNLRQAAAAIVHAESGGAEVIVLPELVTSGYCFNSADEAHSVALPADDAVFAEWAATCGKAVVAAGFAELGDDGLLYNSAVLLDHSGVLATYRKVHLWDAEKLVFTPGDAAPPVVETDFGRIALMVCYDVEFPEMTRSVALRGADLLTVPTNWPWVSRPDDMPAPEVMIAMAAARVNRMAIACCDRQGEERGQNWNEASAIIGADGWLRASAADVPLAQPRVVSAELDLLEGRDKAISTRNDVFADRRPSVY